MEKNTLKIGQTNDNSKTKVDNNPKIFFYEMGILSFSHFKSFPKPPEIIYKSFDSKTSEIMQKFDRN